MNLVIANLHRVSEELLKIFPLFFMKDLSYSDDNSYPVGFRDVYELKQFFVEFEKRLHIISQAVGITFN